MRMSILAACLVVLCAPSAQAGPGDRLVGQAAAILAGPRPELRLKAALLLERAAALGNPDGQFLLGMLKVRGTVVEKAPADGAQLLAKAAAQGHGEAANALGLLHLSGEGVARDPARAVEWLRQAAAKGVTEAQHNLGWLAQTGVGMNADLAEAARWYRLAADKGYSRSQYHLGLLMAVGVEGAPDLPQALKWLALAAKSPRAEVRGQAEAKFRLVSSQAPAEAVTAGQEEARKWLVDKRVF